MKLKVYSGVKPKRPLEAFLILEEKPGGIVQVRAVDEDGEKYSCGCLLDIFPDGKVSFHGGVTVPGLPNQLSIR